MRRIFTYFLTSFLFLLLCSPSHGQFKKLFSPDSLTLTNIGILSAEEVIYTGIPDREIAVVGFLTGQDTSGASLQSAYLLQLNSEGVPQSFSHYHDTTLLFFPGARAYGGCYDGNGYFYIAVGSNDQCLLIKADTAGNVVWITDGGHHDYYDVTYHNGTLAALGQNESFTGAHDYSITRFDENGASSTPDMMYGTVGFDVPKAIVNTPDGYVICGFSANGSNRANLIIKAKPDLDPEWSRVWQVVDKRLTGEDLVALPNYRGFYTVGQFESTTGGTDSIYVMRMDTGGNATWMHAYGMSADDDLVVTSVDLLPDHDRLLVGGYYRVGSFAKGFVMSVDSSGNFEWARDYADPDTMIEESVIDITVSPNGEYFFATGKYVFFDGVNLTNKVVVWKGPTTNGDIPCDTSLVFGSREAFPYDADVILTEPFSNNDPYPLVAYTGGTVVEEIICYAMVSAAEAVPEQELLQVVNPVESDLVVWYELGLESGELELYDLQGRTLFRQEVEAGAQRIVIPASQVPGGIYILALKSQGKVLSHQKLLFR